MKQLLLFAFLLIVVFPTIAQNVKSRRVDTEDVVTLLKEAGYDIYSFDLNDFMKGDYNVKLHIKEYEKDKGEINVQNFDAGVNKILFSDFSDEEKQYAKEIGLTQGMKRGVVYKIDKVNLGVVPSKEDSLMTLNVVYGNMGTVSQQLKLRSISYPNCQYKTYSYEIRPFFIENFDDGKFIPLLAVLSWWYDDKANMFRCCGESVLKSNLLDEIFENVPHYYIIGITLEKQKTK